MTLYEWTMLLLEVYICVILTAEYVFDYKQVMKQARKIKQRVKRNEAFESLTTGEGR